MEPIEIAGAVFGTLSAFGGFIALIVGIITNTSKFKEWHHDRMDRDANLDTLANNIDLIRDLINQSGSISEMSEKLKVIDSKLRRVLSDNKRQDRQIRDSLRERKLFMIGLMALLDWAIANGANGSIRKAYNELRDYQYHRTHVFNNFYDEDREEENDEDIF